MVGRLLGFTDLVLDALPCPCDFAFHAEVFHTPDDRLVLCEIACRTGGATIRDIQHTLFGLDLTESWVRAQLGLPLPVAAGPGRLYPARMAGQLVLMKRPGRVVAVPGEPSFPWVERYRVFAQPGQVMGEATFSGDFLASMVVSAPSRAISERRLRELEAWFMAGISIEEVT
jgi:hypothetical protein